MNSFFKKVFSKTKLTQQISDIFSKGKLDEETIIALEEALILADVGPKASKMLVQEILKTKFNKNITEKEVREALAKAITNILLPYKREISLSGTPHVIIFIGVNGNGKTTTLAKFANVFKQQGLKIKLVACDTFRAAAIEQLKIWADRLEIGLEEAAIGSDPASLAFNAFKNSNEQKNDVILIDTAGRLHNRDDLMAELEKICRVLKKINPEAPHDVLLVLDGTTGQTAHAQIKAFAQRINITGLIITKLDGTAKGGAIISLVQEYKIPIIAIGTGELINDLISFSPEEFARELLNL